MIVLDEPNANLDETGEQALLQALQQLRERNVTVVLITHRPQVLKVTSHLLVLREGRLQKFGPTEEILQAQSAARQSATSANGPMASPYPQGAYTYGNVSINRQEQRA